MTGYKLFCLGPPLLTLDDQPVKLEMRKSLALLVYLRLAEHGVSRETLSALFWPEFDQRHAQANLRRVLSSLNNSLEIDLLETDRERVGLRDRSLLWLDIEAFQQYLASVMSHAHIDLGSCPGCHLSLEAAMQINRGDFLEGFNLGDCPGFDQWQFLQREHLHFEFAKILNLAAAGYAARSKWEDAIAYTRCWVALDSLNEPAQRSLISLFARAGQRSAALRQCDEIERLIKMELNQEPERETVELIRMLRQSSAAAPSAGPIPSPAPMIAPLTPEPLLKSKLYIPFSRSKRVQRARLVSQLNGIEEHPVTILSAPAGFGKTTALTEWVLQSQLPVGWVSLDSSDNDPFRFLSYLIEALGSIQSLTRADFPNMLQFSQAASLHAVLITLLHALEQNITPYVLVLDDYQFIDTPSIHELVAFMLDHLPSGMRLVISSRTDPPFPLARLRAREQLLEIRTNDLRFTLEEAGAFLNQVMGLALSAGDIANLDQRTEGWIVGLQLAAHSLKDVEMPARFIQAFSGSHRFILDYLVEEVLGRQAAPIQDFLLQTSILTRLCGPLCDVVAGIQARQIKDLPPITGFQPPYTGQQILEYLDRINLFLVPFDSERHWYRYHHLFADLLQARLQQAHPEQLSSLHQRAAGWYDENGFSLDAVRHALASKDEKYAAELIAKYAEEIIHNGRFSTVLGWMKNLSKDLIRRKPWLCVWYAWALLQSGTCEGVDELIRDTENILQNHADQESGLSSDETQAIKDQIITLQATVASLRDDNERTITLSLQALSQIHISKDWQRINILYILGNTYYILGELSKAELYYLQVRKIAEKISFFTRYILSTYRLAHIRHIRGDLHQAYDLYQAGLQVAADQDKEKDLGMGFIYAGCGEILYEWNRLDEAKEMILEGIRVDELTKVPMMLANSYNTYARLLIELGDLEAARSLLLKVRDMVQKYPISPEAIEVNRACWARLWLDLGDQDSAHAWVQEREQVADHPPSFSRLPGEMAYARLLIAGGQLPQAGGLLAQLAAAAETGDWISWLIEIRILQARVAQARGLEDEALDFLGESLGLAKPRGHIRLYVAEGKPIESLLRAGLEQGRWAETEMAAYINNLRRAF